MKREIIKLVGGIPSVIPTATQKQLGKHDRVTKWVWSGFHNPARNDNLILAHWQRFEDVDKDYEYAQFNKKIKLVEFTPEEYENLIKDMDSLWSYEETMYLWELCRQFDLRFIPIHDRYDSKYNRTVEDLKDRYYSIARKILESRNQFDHPI
jgi:DNA methyltransferase 1-associated protein 1